MTTKAELMRRAEVVSGVGLDSWIARIPQHCTDSEREKYSVKYQAIAGEAWRLSGYPVIQLHGAKYAAALMATRVYEPKTIKFPWDAFLIEVPDGTVSTIERAWFPRTVLCLTGMAGPIGSKSATVLIAFGVDRFKFFFLDSVEYFGTPQEHDQRMGMAVKRLVANACSAMAAERPAPRRSVSKAPRNEPASKPVSFSAYAIGRPVVVDCRPELSAFISGRRSTSPAVRWLVRGHWRNQVHGADRAERRLTWIEPHWKGHEDAPINVRPHILRETVPS